MLSLEYNSSMSMNAKIKTKEIAKKLAHAQTTKYKEEYKVERDKNEVKDTPVCAKLVWYSNATMNYESFACLR